MDIGKLVAVAVVGAILALTVQQQRKEMGLVVSLAAGTLLLLESSGWLRELVSGLSQLAERAGMAGDQLKLLLKLLAISYVVEFGSEVCKDAGQQALAAKIQLGGRLMMAGMTLPVFLSLIHLIGDLLS